MSGFVEIKGIGFPNKGADLLLEACVQRLSPNFQLAIEPFGDYSYRARYPLWTKLRATAKGANLLAPLAIVPSYVRRRMGWITASEVACAIDASGYAYGDPWSAALARQRVLGELRSRPILFLPQTFGPFRTRAAKETIKRIAGESPLVFAREPISADEIFVATGRRVEVVPDITFGLAVEPGQVDKRDVLLIPNFQVAARQGPSYEGCLLAIATRVRELGRTPCFLVHEGRRDIEIAQRVVASMPGSPHEACPEVIVAQSGMHAKQVIGGSRFVVTSRYHGFISALSQRVPAVALGWSYKYDEVARQFGLQQFGADNLSAVQADPVISLLLSDAFANHSKSMEFASALAGACHKIDSMWLQVQKELAR